MFVAIKSDWVDSDCCFTIIDLVFHSNQGGNGGKAVEFGILGFHVMFGTV
jgi:hypothetical protein